MGKSNRREIPRYRTPIIETHCHLDYLEAETLENVLERSRECGIERIITIAVSADNLDRVAQLALGHPDVWGTQGIHPHEAESYSDEVEARVQAGTTMPRILAVGEIGLDYYYDHADRGTQRAVFERQLELAAQVDLPVVIHTRDADEDTRSILADHARHLRRKGVIHSFTSGLALAEFCLTEGFSLGFNGITTFNQADNVRAVVAATPVEQILLETDAPYLTPVPYRGKPNAPYYLPFIAEQVAAVKSMNVENLLQRAYDNSMALFFADAA